MQHVLSTERQNELRAKLIAIHFDEFDEELSDFKADRLLDAFLEKLVPAIYNAAIQDMKRFMLDQLEDLEAIHTRDI